MGSYKQDDKFKSNQFSQTIPVTFLHKTFLVCYKTQSENSISGLWNAVNSYLNSKLEHQFTFWKKLKFKFAKYITNVQVV